MIVSQTELADFCRRWKITPQEAREYGGVLFILLRADPLKLSEFKARRLLGDETVDAWKMEEAKRALNGGPHD